MQETRGQLGMLDPVAEVRVPDTKPHSAAKLDVIGFVDNGWWSLGKVLTRFEDLFQTQAHTSKIIWKKKPDASNSAPKEVFDELSSRADAVVVGLGN